MGKGLVLVREMLRLELSAFDAERLQQRFKSRCPSVSKTCIESERKNIPYQSPRQRFAKGRESRREREK